MKLEIGQSVRVKQGVLCPDDPEFDISGWQGRITEIDDDDSGEISIDIEWDSVTLKNIPDKYIEISETDGLDWACMCLYSSDLEKVRPRDSEADTDETREELENRVEWLGLGEEGKRIQAVVNCAESNDEWGVLEAWEKHLIENLNFPLEGVVDEFISGGPLRMGSKLKVLSIDMIDEFCDIVVSCSLGRKRYDFPLADLAAVDEQSAAARQIQDYRVWFANK